ncbi:DUF4383 domain-containing protein [Gilvimarinus sp. F26214L]|uniref:DUF4383 domain-containing protein n=1 Tax=Gilvimarinus sp. DZF01 TaxID=3461371 RepID=UPI0040456952
MAIRYFALIYGTIFTIIGIAGFIPFLVTPYGIADPDLAVTGAAGHLFGLFPVNVLHDLVHIAFGIWGLAVWRNTAKSKSYAKAVAVIYAILTVMGLIPALRTTFGLIPLHGNDVWLHLLLAGGAAYFGWAYRPATVAHGERRH